MIWNEASVLGKIYSEEDFKYYMKQFIIVCHSVKSNEKKLNFYYDSSIFGMVDGYTINNWLRDKSVRREEQTFFRTLLNKGYSFEKEKYWGSDFEIILPDERRISSTGCLMAYETDSFVVSFISDSVWKQDTIWGNYSAVIDDNDFNEEKNVFIKNISTLEHANHRKTRICEQQIIVSSGAELWEKRQILYPNLVFCECVKKQFQEVNIDLHLQTIMKRLQIIDDYFRDYDGIFNSNIMGHKCRYESETVRNDSKLSEKRKFVAPDGVERYFYWHISFSGNYPGRIHFEPDDANRKGIIGYVGKHLPTANYSTI